MAYPRRNKFGAVKTAVDGIKFASKREANRYIELSLFERKGHIKDLKLQVPFLITINGSKICKYLADFTYTDKQGGYHVEDVKGFDTPMGRLKRKMVEASYPVKVEIVK